MKVDLERFGCNNPRQDFKFMKNVVKIAIYLYVLGNNRRKCCYSGSSYL